MKIEPNKPSWHYPPIAVPLNQAFPQLGEMREFKHKQCLFNHDRSRLFDVVSDRYQLVSHKDAVDTVSQAIQTYFGVAVVPKIRTIGDGVRIRAEYKLPCAPIKIGRGDVSELTVVMQNSYDRSKVFSAELGAFRLVCANGMMLGESFGSIKARHIVRLEEQPGILTDLESMLSNAPRVKQAWETWSKMTITLEEAQRVLLGKFPDKYLEYVLDPSKYPGTLWDVYNRLTWFSTHQTKSLKRRIEFDERIAKLFYTKPDFKGILK